MSATSKNSISWFVDVLPLEPPFPAGLEVHSIVFADLDGRLAVSQEDFAKVSDLLGTDPTGRQVTLSACPDGIHIRIEVYRS